MINDKENLKKRLIYRSQYRGTKEMDKLVGRFVQTNINNFNEIQLKELEKSEGQKIQKVRELEKLPMES